jgi:hypothetical protein
LKLRKGNKRVYRSIAMATTVDVATEDPTGCCNYPTAIPQIQGS